MPRALRRFSAGTRLSGFPCNSSNLPVSVRMRLSSWTLSVANVELAKPSSTKPRVSVFIGEYLPHCRVQCKGRVAEIFYRASPHQMEEACTVFFDRAEQPGTAEARAADLLIGALAGRRPIRR